MTRGGPVNATHLNGDLALPRAIIAGVGRRRRDLKRDDSVPPAIMVSWFGLQRRKWRGRNND
jgi:multiple sugar transport system permease protein